MKRTLLISVVLHAFAIALLLTISFPDPSPPRFARVTPIASPYRSPVLVPVRVHMKLAPRLAALPVPPRLAARSFRVPEPLPQPAPPRLAPAIPEPPSINVIHAPDVLPPAAAPGIVALPPPARVVKAAGFGSPEIGEPAAVHRTLTAAGGFESGAASAPAVTRAAITSAAFGDASSLAPSARVRQSVALPGYSAAEIIAKPRPAYTDEARRLAIQGEVLLEVLFAASGEARVLRTIRGLGHGLDENAVSAARSIQFRPAQRGGVDVDSTAVVHIVFQLVN